MERESLLHGCLMAEDQDLNKMHLDIVKKLLKLTKTLNLLLALNERDPLMPLPPLMVSFKQHNQMLKFDLICYWC